MSREETPGPVLLIASGGGHLRQLHDISRRLPFRDRGYIWAAPSGTLSNELLAEEEWVHLRYNGPRSIAGVARNARILGQALRGKKISAVVTTGANHGLAGYHLALFRNLPFYFIDTAARVTHPSLTGRIVTALPRTLSYAQYPHRTNRKWSFSGSVFDKYYPVDREGPELSPLSVVVTVGAMEDLGFDRLVSAAERAIPDEVTVHWQVGPTQRGKYSDAQKFAPGGDMRHWMESAASVISHAGVGSALTALEAGVVPVLVPRLSSHGEHVDDHQLQIAEYLRQRGLAEVCSPDELTWDVVMRAAQREVRVLPDVPDFVL